MNKKYHITLEVLTPVHIGNGQTISGIDYFCFQEHLEPPYKKSSDGKDIKHASFLYKFNINDFENILDDGDKKDFQNMLYRGTDTFEIRNFIFQKLENNKNIYREKFINISKPKIEITNAFYKLWREKIIGKSKGFKGKTQEKREAEFTNQLSQLHINSFINSLGRYYIPGSSLKGAIRTILTTKEIEDGKTERDPFKKLIVRDSDFIKQIEIGRLARQSIKGEGTYAEFLPIGTESQTQILFKDFIDEKNLVKIDISKDEIIKKSNNYLKNKIEKYIQELIDLKNHPDLRGKDSGSIKKKMKIDSVMDSFNNILKELNNLSDKECILNIGFGGGYWFKSFEGDETHPSTFRIKHLKNEDINIPRTSWNIDLENLGFIKLTFND